jgi:hypothetical protein
VENSRIEESPAPKEYGRQTETRYNKNETTMGREESFPKFKLGNESSEYRRRRRIDLHR